MKHTTPASRYAAAIELPAVAEAMATGLGAALPDARWESLRVAKALPAGVGGLAVQYTVTTTDGQTSHIGGLLPADPTDRPGWAGAAAGTLWWEDCGLALALPHSDPRLSGVAVTLTPAWRGQLARRLGWQGEPTAAARILAYRLAKRCVLRVTAGADTAFVKVLRPRQMDSLVALHESALAEGAVAVPRVLAVDREVCAMVMTEVPGVVLSDVDPAASLAAHEAAGALLRRFHRPAGGQLACRAPADEVSQLMNWTASAGDRLPELAARLGRSLRGLGPGPATGGLKSCRLHRDFYDKQLILGPDQQLTLLDLDTVAEGDPALDLGNYLAHVHLRGLQMPHAAGPAPAQISHAFLAGYGPDGGTQDRLTWWRAAALLRLAVVYSLRPRWRPITESLLEAVESC